jgi:leader peptidase (prepilin peptidase) / N-methyltransferase
MIIPIFIFIMGLIFGSFLNVIIHRLKHGGKIMNSRSICPHCKKILKARDLIPVISFIILRGNCRYCSKKISWQYPLVELVTAILFLLVFLAIGTIAWPLIVRNLFVVLVLVVVFMYDFLYYQILDKVMIPAIVVVLAFNLWLGVTWQSMLIGGLVGLLFFLIQFLVSKGKWIGDGDLRFGLFMGVLLGWPVVLVGIFLSYIIGAVISIFLLLGKVKKAGSQIPLGTFLSIGTLVSLLYGEVIINWYLGLIL